MKAKDKSVKPKSVTQYSVWTKCTAGHKYSFDCGVIIDPIPQKCPQPGCNAYVTDSGKTSCGIA